MSALIVVVVDIHFKICTCIHSWHVHKASKIGYILTFCYVLNYTYIAIWSNNKVICIYNACINFAKYRLTLTSGFFDDAAGISRTIKSESDELSTLRSELAKKEKYNEELRKEIEVFICNNTYVYITIQCTYIRTYVCCYIPA